MSYASILSPYAFHYLFIYAFRFNSTYMITLDIFKVDFESWKGANVTIYCNASLFGSIMQTLPPSYLLYLDCSTFRRFAQPPPNHTSIALYVSPLIHVSHLIVSP